MSSPESSIDGPKAPLLLLPASVYLWVNVFVPVLVGGGINAGLAYVMYKDEEKLKKMAMWAIPDTIMGDLVVTTLVSWILTFVVSSGLAVRDLTLRYPIALKKESIPVSWTDAFAKTLGCGAWQTEPDLENEPSGLLQFLSHTPPLCLPGGDMEEAEVDLAEIARRMAGNDEAGGEPMGTCCFCPGVGKAIGGSALWGLLFILGLALPLSGILSIRGTEAGLWSWEELVLLKGLYGGLLEIPISWMTCVSVMVWHSRRKARIVRTHGKDSYGTVQKTPTMA